ncbi:hypothetical protein [Propionispira raffinosivorans]|uniref:hypothetical protein n=1 Tax=Propionispira raffinosivorans TaxID=86959 RepID=UPI00036B5FD9|nr:hypothetical protein [Propionispira raffinosivorans]
MNRLTNIKKTINILASSNSEGKTLLGTKDIFRAGLKIILRLDLIKVIINRCLNIVAKYSNDKTQRVG